MHEKKEKADKKKKISVNDLEPATNSVPRPRANKSIYSQTAKEMKAILKDLSHIPKVEEGDMEKMLIAIAYGLVPDRFGLEAGLDTRLKAFEQLQKLQQNKNNEHEHEEDYFDKLNETLQSRKLEGVDDESNTE